MSTSSIPKTYAGILTLTLTALFVASCNGGAVTQFPSMPDTIEICHATGDTTIPYTELALTLDELSAHSQHSDDIIPAPAEGCPSEPVANGNDGKITICHATGSPSNPYTKISVAFSGLSGHARHENDFILEPETAECPSTATPTPVETASPAATETATATPQATPTGGQSDTIVICHATGSRTNPYVMITVSVNGLNGHGKHKNDIIPAPAGGCP